MSRMRAAVLHGAEDVRIEDLPIPPVGPGEVRVRIHAALTCGTDAKVFRRGYHAKMIVPPAVFGHEFAGVVDAVGSGVTQFAVGDRVVAANSAPCGKCFYCQRDQAELCADLLFLNGAYAEYITVPARIVGCNLLALPDHLSYSAAALCEPLACCLKGVEDTAVRAGERVVVLGSGPIGLLVTRLCALRGAAVAAVGRREARLAAAGALGAELVVDEAAGEALAAVREWTDGRGADRVIECVGQPAAWEQAIALTRRGGVCNLFGGCPAGTSVTVDTGRLHYEELTLLGSFHHTPRLIAAALHLLAAGVIPAELLINDQITLGEVPAALRRMGTRSALIKAAVQVGEDTANS
ncbi:MAG: alcohol dehydrogenase catalytic domain-containing protein [Fimbriimonadaceae bacterium]|nr:alcohol dehydrogenase catalytic domain-containing protein [Fimbriimonadaceae bacterium]